MPRKFNSGSAKATRPGQTVRDGSSGGGLIPPPDPLSFGHSLKLAVARPYVSVTSPKLVIDRVMENLSQIKEGKIVKKLVLALVLSGALGSVTVLAQEQKGMPMGGGGMMDKMMQMQGRMGEMQKGMGGMMKGKGMMKGEDMRGMGNMMGKMSGTMGDMGQMIEGGKMTPEEMENMSKMMGEMSGMMKQMSERIRRGMKKIQKKRRRV